MKNSDILNENSVVLVTGGGKGITANSAIKIAESAGCKLVLIGRSQLLDSEPEWADGAQQTVDLKKRALVALQEKGEKISPKKIEKIIQQIISTREINATLNNIQTAGGSAIYLSADVTDFHTLEKRLGEAVEALGPITGIIHGAGNLADKRIESKTARDFDLVVNTKIVGLENILNTVDMDALKFLVLFSSVAGFFGNAGQTDYAIANEILNKSAYLLQRSLPNCRVVSINWGPWDSGMVSPQLKKLFRERNIQLISAKAGVETLVDILANEENNESQILIGASLDQNHVIEHNFPETIRIQREIKHGDNKFLDDHIIGGQAVLPATCASAWLADTCVSLNPGYFFESMDDFKILKGLTFENDSQEYHLELKTDKDMGSGRKKYEILISSDNENGRKIFHYSGKVTLNNTSPHPLTHSASEISGLNNPSFQDGKMFYENGSLFHGPFFQGIQEVHQLSKERVITRVFLPKMSPQAQGQFTALNTNPYINDAIVQSLLLWTQEFYDAPCLPSRLHHWDNFRAVPFGEPVWAILDITYHNEHAVTGDIVVMDQEGREFFTFEGLEGTVSKHLKRYIGKKE